MERPLDFFFFGAPPTELYSLGPTENVESIIAKMISERFTECLPTFFKGSGLFYWITVSSNRVGFGKALSSKQVHHEQERFHNNFECVQRRTVAS